VRDIRKIVAYKREKMSLGKILHVLKESGLFL